MSAGELRERLRFERRTSQGDDGYGNVVYVWAELATMAARVDPKSGDEDVMAQSLQGIGTFELTVRWSPVAKSFRASDRAVDARDSSRVFNIRTAANEDEKRRYMTMIATVGDASG